MLDDLEKQSIDKLSKKFNFFKYLPDRPHSAQDTNSSGLPVFLFSLASPKQKSQYPEGLTSFFLSGPGGPPEIGPVIGIGTPPGGGGPPYPIGGWS